jgi:predicted peptidase
MKLPVLALLLIPLLGAAGGAARPDPAQTGFLFRSIKVGAEEFKYAVYVPRDYDASKVWPAIVFLHGSGECGRDGQKQLAFGLPPAVLQSADRWPCIIICPQKPEQARQWEDYDSAVMAMLAAAEHEWKIDADRVCLTGLSQGGHGAWTIGAAHADRFAAIVPVCGYIRGMDAADLARKLGDRPIWAFHGDADTTVPVDETKRMVAALESARGLKPGAQDTRLHMTIYPGVGHDSWGKAYSDPELATWLMSKRRDPSAK